MAPSERLDGLLGKIARRESNDLSAGLRHMGLFLSPIVFRIENDEVGETQSDTKKE